MNYNSDNSAPGTQAQMPNRKGNISKKPPQSNVGVTAITKPQGGLSQPKGAQGCVYGNGNIATRNQKVMVSRPADKYGNNDGYKNSDRNNYLK